MDEIGISDVINQVKRELLARDAAAAARDPFPLFVIENIELEIQTRITKGRDGSVQLSVLGVGFGGGTSDTHERAHVVRLTLKPLVSGEQLRQAVANDAQLQKLLKETIVRGDDGLV